MRPDEEIRPAGNRAGNKTVGGTTASVPASGAPKDRLRCPLVRAAYRLDDPDTLVVVQRVHPPEYCPTARQMAA
ncbi:MAG TPA: hypothetical protein VFZ32_13955 [Micromonosporaceae bacterium]